MQSFDGDKDAPRSLEWQNSANDKLPVLADNYRGKARCLLPVQLLVRNYRAVQVEEQWDERKEQRCTVAPGALRNEHGKLACESLYYSCQVCSNHVRYFNKREQQGETGYLILPSSLPPSPLPPSFFSFYLTPACPPRWNPLGEPRTPSLPSSILSLTFLLTIYIYIATPRWSCYRVYSRTFVRRRESPVRQDINGNSDFFEASSILANRPRTDLSQKFIRLDSRSSYPRFFRRRPRRRIEALINESVQFWRSVRRVFEA